MGNNSQSSSQIISLPKGGGALQGIGEKFSPDLFTGTGNFSIPITIPPGRNGFQPELSLVYSTGNGNGPFGLGWALNIPGVSRKTSKGVPVYDDREDVFILSRVEDLVEVPGAPEDATRCRPRTEGLFALIDHFNTHDSDYWRVKSKDGLISWYGTPRPENMAFDWSDPAIITQPENRDKIFAWNLTETRDPFGNRIIYEYQRDQTQQWDQVYLRKIKYIDIDKKENPRYLVSVSFIYGDRPDSFSSYRSGFEIRTQKRCERIEIRTHANDGDQSNNPIYIEEGRLIRSYQFVYLDEEVHLKSKLPLNGVSLLHEVKVIGHDGALYEELAPLTFAYSQFQPKDRKFFPLEGNLPAQSLNDPKLELVDLFGNGLPDILEMGTYIRYWRNLGKGKFDMPKEMEEAPAGLQLLDGEVHFLDANGDGRTDLLVMKDTQGGYYSSRFGAQWDRKSFQKFKYHPSFKFKDPEVQLIDLDGNGITDVIRSGSRLECFFLDAKEGWRDTRWVERRNIEEFPDINFSDPRVRLADMSGDGLQDIVLVYDGNIEYWPNLGHGEWAARRSMLRNPRFPYGYNPSRILIGDVDGDGLADLIYVDDSKVTLWINQSGNQWSEPIVIKGTPPISDADNIQLTDILGNGVGGILWSGIDGSYKQNHYYFLDFTGGDKPYLLCEMNNNMGSVTKVGYQSSIQYYLKDQQQSESRWLTTLPFPVQVVSVVEVIDEISKGKLTTEYTYHHGYWDGTEREFRGFGRVDQRDTETFWKYHQGNLHLDTFFEAVPEEYFSPPLESRNWFHLGPIGDEFGGWKEVDFSRQYWPEDPQKLERPSAMRQLWKKLPRRSYRDALRTLKGRKLRTELYALDGSSRQNRPYAVTEASFGVSTLPIGEVLPEIPESWQLQVFFPYLVAERSSQWERGEDPMTRFNFKEKFDAYGQPQIQTDIACPRGWRKMDDIFTNESDLSDHCPQFLATRSETIFAYSKEEKPYIKDRVARSITYELKHPTGTAYSLSQLKDKEVTLFDIIGDSIHYYDGSNYIGLPEGEIGDHGALMCTKSLVLADEILRDVWGEENIPAYLNPEMGEWPEEYPDYFKESLMAQAGYLYENGFFYSLTERRAYEKNFGLLTGMKDPLGYEKSISYDPFFLKPVEVRNAAGLTTQAAFNYRTFQPWQIIDENGNHRLITYSPLGLLKSIAALGKRGENVGDKGPEGILPSTIFEYDFGAFKNSPPDNRQPVWVKSIKREYHISDAGHSTEELEKSITTLTYSDGFNRQIQQRSSSRDVIWKLETENDGADDEVAANIILPVDQNEDSDRPLIGVQNAEPDLPNVVVSEWQIYNNKGHVMERYEPFFSQGWAFQPPQEQEIGQKVKMYYDPRGKLIRIINPNGSERCIINGIPNEVSAPADFTPSPWETYTYDPNDNAGRTHPVDAGAYQEHWNTPSQVIRDALGRKIVEVEHLGPQIEDQLVTRTAYDISGNVLNISDSLGREAFKSKYDLQGKVLKTENIDAGDRWSVWDARNKEIEKRDAKGALILQSFDALNRNTHLWAREAPTTDTTLRHYRIYGDQAELENPQSNNLLGQPYEVYDEAGKLTFLAYDFKGNMLAKSRELIKDELIVEKMDSPQLEYFAVDWTSSSEKTIRSLEEYYLENTSYQWNYQYDALKRVRKMIYPENVEGHRSFLQIDYDRRGSLQQLSYGSDHQAPDGKEDPFVRQIAYNARAQPALILYGNGLMTRYAYDPESFRLARLRTETFEWTGDNYIIPGNNVLQDLAYTYDLAGNFLSITHQEPHSGVAGATDLERAFTYDPLYRLTSATGRMQKEPLSDPARPWLEFLEHLNPDPTQTEEYRRQYSYDKTGNMKLLRHQRRTPGKTNFETVWTKEFITQPGRNFLAKVKRSNNGVEWSYQYDANGNLIQESESRHFYWNHSDQLHAFRQQANDHSNPSQEVRYLYDIAGRRTKKITRNGRQTKTSIYLDDLFEYHRKGGRQNNHIHLMGLQQRVAVIRAGEPFSDDEGPAVQYHFGDHLGNSSLVVDKAGSWINSEAYFPFGGTSYGSFRKKRYRFGGKEYDEESGLYYFGYRYYLPWLQRWSTCDPEWRRHQFGNLYIYAKANPIRYLDLKGRTAKESNANNIESPEEIEARKQGISKETKRGENMGMLVFGLVGLGAGALLGGLIGLGVGALLGSEAIAKSAVIGAIFGGALLGRLLMKEGKTLGPLFFSDYKKYEPKKSLSPTTVDDVLASIFAPINAINNFFNVVTNTPKKQESKPEPKAEVPVEPPAAPDQSATEPESYEPEKLLPEIIKETRDHIMAIPEEEKAELDSYILELLQKPIEELGLDEKVFIQLYHLDFTTKDEGPSMGELESIEGIRM